MKNTLFLLVFATILLSACNKEALKGGLAENEYLIFGTFYGECVGNCTNLFKLENEQLYEDDIEWGVPDEIPFTNTPLDNDAYQTAMELIESFPNDLLDSDERRYGCPDCGDQGGFYIELMLDGNREIWLIDTYDDEQSQAIIDYKSQIETVMMEL